MTKKFTQSRLLKRDKIIKSHTIFGNFLNSNILNALINLFDDNKNKYVNKIISYITDERKQRGLNDANIKIESELYGTENEN